MDDSKTLTEAFEERDRTLPSTCISKPSESLRPKPSAKVRDLVSRLGLRFRPTNAADLGAHAASLSLLASDMAEIPADLLEKAINRHVTASPYMPKAADLFRFAKEIEAEGRAKLPQRTNRTYAYDLADLYNSQRTRDDIEWIVDDTGQLKLRDRPEWSAQNDRAMTDRARTPGMGKKQPAPRRMGMMARKGVTQSMDGPTPEQLAKGGYRRQFTSHTESATLARTHKSNHDPVERWKAAGKLEPHQIAAIELCQRLWELSGRPIRVTASYGERIPSAASTEAMTNAQVQAGKDLRRIMVQFVGLGKWWNVFENVCRFGEPAGVAGSRLGYGGRSGADRAHTVVCFVADKIAEHERL